MTNEELVALIQAGENVAENMELLYDQIKGLICSIAWRYRNAGEIEDLEQEGFLALYSAVDGFDPAAGCRFSSYAEKWIRQRMIRYIQDCGSCLRSIVWRKYRSIKDSARIMKRNTAGRLLTRPWGVSWDFLPNRWRISRPTPVWPVWGAWTLLWSVLMGRRIQL